MNRSFDRIVSAYVFHHFKLDEKLRILRGLLPHLAPGGRMVIGDIAFRDQSAGFPLCGCLLDSALTRPLRLEE